MKIRRPDRTVFVPQEEEIYDEEKENEMVSFETPSEVFSVEMQPKKQCALRVTRFQQEEDEDDRSSATILFDDLREGTWKICQMDDEHYLVACESFFDEYVSMRKHQSELEKLHDITVYSAEEHKCLSQKIKETQSQAQFAADFLDANTLNPVVEFEENSIVEFTLDVAREELGRMTDEKIEKLSEALNCDYGVDRIFKLNNQSFVLNTRDWRFNILVSESIVDDINGFVIEQAPHKPSPIKGKDLPPWLKELIDDETVDVSNDDDE